MSQFGAIFILVMGMLLMQSHSLLQSALLRKAVRNLGSIATSLAIVTGANTVAHAEDTTTNQVVNSNDYGLQEGRLRKCKTISNCISTSSINSVEKYGRPWVFSKPGEEEFQQLVGAIKADPFLKLVEQDATKQYLHIEAKSAFPPDGIDDYEFLVNNDDKIISYRGNSRTPVKLGGSQIVGDAGVIRNRLSSIQRKLNVREMAMDTETENFMNSMKKKNIFELIQEASQPNEINFIDNSVPDGNEE